MSKKGIISLMVLFGCAAVAIWFFWKSPESVSQTSGRRAIETADAPKAIGPYSQAVSTGNLVFVSGQLGLDAQSGNLVEGGVEAETEQAMRNLEAVLKASNSSFDHVVKTTIFLTDIGDFPKVNEIYGRFFKPPYPARATVQVAKLPRDAKIEIEMTAVARPR